MPALLALGCGAAQSPAPASGASVCDLPANTHLVIALRPLELAPGATETLRVYQTTHPSAAEPLPAGCAARWEVEPGTHARVEPDTGVVSVAAAAPADHVFTVRATVAGRSVETPVRVLDPRAHPLRGNWREVGRIGCDGSALPTRSEAIPQIEFRADGTFNALVTYSRHNQDFEGQYRYDPATRALRLAPSPGGELAADFDGEGSAELQAPDRLVLREMWLGSRGSESRQGVCGAVFQRTGAP